MYADRILPATGPNCRSHRRILLDSICGRNRSRVREFRCLVCMISRAESQVLHCGTRLAVLALDNSDSQSQSEREKTTRRIEVPELIQLRTREQITATPASSAMVGAEVLDAPQTIVMEEDEKGLFVTQYLYRYELSPDTWLLCNTLTGAVDAVDRRTAGIFQPRARIDRSQLTPEELVTFSERGYLTDRHRARANVARWFDDFKQRMRSLHFIVCPTFTCNLRCPYCYEDLEIRQSKSAVSPLQVDHMFEAMGRFVDERAARDVLLELFGGEPFLRANRHTVELIVERAANKGWKISGITNGTQIDAYFSVFERLSPAITQIQVTIDG